MSDFLEGPQTQFELRPLHKQKAKPKHVVRTDAQLAKQVAEWDRLNAEATRRALAKTHAKVAPPPSMGALEASYRLMPRVVRGTSSQGKGGAAQLAGQQVYQSLQYFKQYLKLERAKKGRLLKKAAGKKAATRLATRGPQVSELRVKAKRSAGYKKGVKQRAAEKSTKLDAAKLATLKRERLRAAKKSATRLRKAERLKSAQALKHGKLAGQRLKERLKRGEMLRKAEVKRILQAQRAAKKAATKAASQQTIGERLLQQIKTRIPTMTKFPTLMGAVEKMAAGKTGTKQEKELCKANCQKPKCVKYENE